MTFPRFPRRVISTAKPPYQPNQGPLRSQTCWPCGSGLIRHILESRLKCALCQILVQSQKNRPLYKTVQPNRTPNNLQRPGYMYPVVGCAKWRELPPFALRTFKRPVLTIRFRQKPHVLWIPNPLVFVRFG